MICILNGHSRSVEFVIFSPDGQLLVSASWDETVPLWDGRTGAHIVTLIGHSGCVWSAAFSRNSLWLASASDDNTVRLWDSRTGKSITILEEHSALVESVMFSADGIPFDTHFICWFPPDSSPCQLTVNRAASTAAIKWQDGRVLLLDIKSSHFLLHSTCYFVSVSPALHMTSTVLYFTIAL